MSTNVILNESNSVVFTDDGSHVTGGGITKVGPISAREIWNPSSAHINANIGSVVNEAACQIYVGSAVGPNNFRDGSLSGSSGDSSDRIDADIIKCGQYVWAVWTGGDIGARGILSVIGTKQV